MDAFSTGETFELMPCNYSDLQVFLGYFCKLFLSELFRI